MVTTDGMLVRHDGTHPPEARAHTFTVAVDHNRRGTNAGHPPSLPRVRPGACRGLRRPEALPGPAELEALCRPSPRLPPVASGCDPVPGVGSGRARHPLLQ